MVLMVHQWLPRTDKVQGDPTTPQNSKPCTKMHLSLYLTCKKFFFFIKTNFLHLKELEIILANCLTVLGLSAHQKAYKSLGRTLKIFKNDK